MASQHLIACALLVLLLLLWIKLAKGAFESLISLAVGALFLLIPMAVAFHMSENKQENFENALFLANDHYLGLIGPFAFSYAMILRGFFGLLLVGAKTVMRLLARMTPRRSGR